MKIKKFGATEQIVFDLAKPIADEYGCDIWDVRFEKEGASWYLRVFIDKEEGITIDDCEAVSRPLSDLLDEKDPISQSYVLEVGSAGLDRELIRESHFDASLGYAVVIKFFRSINGLKETVATLVDYNKEEIKIEIPDEQSEEAVTESIALSDIANIKLYIDFDEFL